MLSQVITTIPPLSFIIDPKNELSLMSPKAENLIRLYCGYFYIRGKPFYNMELIRVPLTLVPLRYHSGLTKNNLPLLTYHQATHQLIWHLLNQRLPTVGRCPDRIKDIVKNWCAYNPEYLNDKRHLDVMINDYTDPRYGYHALQQLINMGCLELEPNPNIRHKLSSVTEMLQYYCDILHIKPRIKSQKQLTRSLNTLIMAQYGVSCIVRDREFNKATRHIKIKGLPHRLIRKYH